jgi:hypothetical protein
VYNSERSLHAVTYVQLGDHSFLFSIMCSGIVGIGVGRTADVVGFEITGTHFGVCCVITELWGVTYLAFHLWQTSVPDNNADFNSRGTEIS